MGSSLSFENTTEKSKRDVLVGQCLNLVAKGELKKAKKFAQKRKIPLGHVVDTFFAHDIVTGAESQYNGSMYFCVSAAHVVAIFPSIHGTEAIEFLKHVLVQDPNCLNVKCGLTGETPVALALRHGNIEVEEK